MRHALDIFVFGLQAFGLHQAERYAALQLLAENPRMGRFAPVLGPEVRRHEHEVMS